MLISDKKGVQQLIQTLVEFGVENIILSPGSRNAPLSLSFNHCDAFKTFVIPDERSAAYFALGVALQTKKPTVICCTSGTAVLNYSPAIAEAFYQNVPLIVITADRPQEWIDQGDGQTIRQKNVYSNFTHSFSGINGDAKTEEELIYLKAEIEKSVYTSFFKNGPVHINVSLQEPLYHLNEYYLNPNKKNPIDRQFEFKFNDELISNWKNTGKVLILVGQNSPNKVLNDILIQLSNTGAVILTEITSNCNHDKFISCIDKTIDGFNEKDKLDFKPDLLITIGDAVVSKKIKNYFRNNSPKYHWNIHPDNAEMNTYSCLTHPIKQLPENILSELVNIKIFRDDSFSNLWRERRTKSEKAQDAYLRNCNFSDLKSFDIILSHIPSHSVLHLGNSSAIRYALLFEPKVEMEYYSNRGVSGIDGSTSTALGYSFYDKRINTLICGDISFFYDSNSLWNDYIQSLKMIVINNGGGGIFRIIDKPKDINDTEKLFEARHQRSVKGLADAFHINYLSANNEESLHLSLKELYKNNEPGILEVFTPTELNPEILKKYFESLKEN